MRKLPFVRKGSFFFEDLIFKFPRCHPALRPIFTDFVAGCQRPDVVALSPPRWLYRDVNVFAGPCEIEYVKCTSIIVQAEYCIHDIEMPIILHHAFSCDRDLRSGGPRATQIHELWEGQNVCIST